MSEKRAYFISCSEHYNHRFRIVDDCLLGRGYQTTYITSDFDHTSKKTFTCSVPGCVQLHAIPYVKNLSARRIISHYRFAADVVRYLENLPQEPDLVIALLPPNFLGDYLARYKKRHPNVKLVFDIFDLWPETFPYGSLKRILAPAFSVWAWIRNQSLPAADWVITECEYFRQRLRLPQEKSSSVYLCQNAVSIDDGTFLLREDGLDLCYLGAINNVIGITEICELIQKLTVHNRVTLHIIGSGERKQEFVDCATAAGAEVICYGAIFDQEKKWEIIRRCHFGLNIMNENACIGLTMKSVDYFSYGLPVINNVPADTERLVTQCGIGIQLNGGCSERVCKLSLNEIYQMQRNVKKVFAEQFSKEVIALKYQQLLDILL